MLNEVGSARDFSAQNHRHPQTHRSCKVQSQPKDCSRREVDGVCKVQSQPKTAASCELEVSILRGEDDQAVAPFSLPRSGGASARATSSAWHDRR
jgi:hypothetical protein